MKTILLIQILLIQLMGNLDIAVFSYPKEDKSVVAETIKPIKSPKRKQIGILVRPKYPIEWVIMRDGIKKFEGFYSNKYKCAGGQVTIGYGHTKTANQLKSVSPQLAHKLLNKDLEESRQKVLEIVKVPLNSWQLACLTSFTFNCGENRLRTLVNGKGRLNNGNYESVKEILPQYRKAGGKVLRGLVIRREWETNLWENS